MEEESGSGLERLRELAKRDCPAWNEDADGISAPAYLRQRLRINSDDASFPALLRAFRRFLKGEGNLRSHPGLRAALLEHYRPEVPDYDSIDFAVYGREQDACNRMYQSMRSFYRIPDGRTEEIAPQLSGRFFLYKTPANPELHHLILRSYARIERPTPPAPYLMIIEMEKAVYENPDIGRQVDHDFYFGIITKKDGALVAVMAQRHNGAMKTAFYDNLSNDSETKRLHRGYGHMIETCDGYSPRLTAFSRCAMLRIPDDITPTQIDERINNVRPEDVDEIIARYIMG